MTSSKSIGIIIGILFAVIFGSVLLSMNFDSFNSPIQNDPLEEEPVSNNSIQISDSATVLKNQTTPKNYDITASDAPILGES